MEQIKMVEMPSGADLKSAGMQLVEQNNKTAVQMMRAYAVQHAAEHGEVTIEDVRKWAESQGMTVMHPNAFGSVFNSRLFERIGFVQNKMPSAHARLVSIWKLKESSNAV